MSLRSAKTKPFEYYFFQVMHVDYYTCSTRSFTSRSIRTGRVLSRHRHSMNHLIRTRTTLKFEVVTRDLLSTRTDDQEWPRNGLLSRHFEYDNIDRCLCTANARLCISKTCTYARTTNRLKCPSSSNSPLKIEY